LNYERFCKIIKYFPWALSGMILSDFSNIKKIVSVWLLIKKSNDVGKFIFKAGILNLFSLRKILVKFDTYKCPWI
jgi:hypothetical protein